MNIREELNGCKRIVIKIGSNCITKNNGLIDNRKIRQIVEDIAELNENRFEIILVSSGAVALGKAYLNQNKGKLKKSKIVQHSASSVGQPKLINTYSRVFEENGILCSQILLTHSDFRDRKRFLHTKDNIETLLENGIIPILNENDSISYTEISVGDNDHLAAQTAQMIDADCLLIITSTDGLYSKDPSLEGAKKISFVKADHDFSEIELNGRSSFGTGGMDSKIKAITKITPIGIKAIIASKNEDQFILRALTKKVGTFFAPRQQFKAEQRKAWVLSTKKPNCHITIDHGASLAILESKSLFAAGITDVVGEFFQGDCIEIKYKNKTLGFGVCEYGHQEIKQIMGSKSTNFENILGFKTSCVVMETINIVVKEEIKHEEYC